MLKFIVICVIIYAVFVSLQRQVAIKKPQRPSSQQNPYDILGISQGATIDQIKDAYREQSRKNHPDLVAHMSKDFQKLAEEKLKMINWAYSNIREERGF